MSNEDNTETPPAEYKVVTAGGNVVLETHDLFKGLDCIKKQSPGAKLIRISDKKVLSYTTGQSGDYRMYSDE